MTQQQKDQALDVLSHCNVHNNQVIELTDDEMTGIEVLNIVKKAVHQAGGKWVAASRSFRTKRNPADVLTEAILWLKSQEVESWTPVVYDGPETIEAESEEEPLNDEQPEDLQFKKERRTLRYDFTAEETHELAMQLAEENRRTASIEEEKSSTAAQYSAKLKESKARLNNLSLLITNGYEMRDVEVEVHYNKPEPGKKTVIRLDTKTTKVEKMEPWEFNLFTQPVEEDYE